MSCRFSPKETVCIKCQILFSGKNFRCNLLKFLPSMLRVKSSEMVRSLTGGSSVIYQIYFCAEKKKNIFLNKKYFSGLPFIVSAKCFLYALFSRSQKEQSMAVCPSPTLPEYKPQSPQTSQQGPAKKRKNNVWGSVLLEQDLTQSMVQGGQVQEKTEFNYVERNVESYDFSKKYEDNRPNFEEEESPEKVESNDPFDKVLDSYTSKISRSLVDYEEGFEDLNPDKPRKRGVKRKADVRDRLGPKVKERLGTKKEPPTLGESNLSEEMEEAEMSRKIAEYLHEPKVEIIGTTYIVFTSGCSLSI